MIEKENDLPEVPYLCVHSRGEKKWVGLDATSNALIGSGGHCKVQLDGKDVQSLHCIVAMKDQHLEVRDWNTGATFLNGHAINETSEMKQGDTLKIGDHEITVVLSNADADTVAVASTDLSLDHGSETSLVTASESSQETEAEFNQPAEQPIEQAVESVQVVESEMPIGVDVEVTDEGKDETLSELETETTSEQQNELETPSAPAEFVYDIDADFEDEVSEIPFGFAAPSFTDDIVDNDELQSLRMENEQLRFELAQQDSKSAKDAEILSRDQTVKLVSRLEELLEELRRSDARSLQMEELLRSADQATQDELDERKQMAKWISELEVRVDQRESESKSEIEQLKKLLEEARQSQQQSNERLKKVLESKSGGGEAIPVELVEELRGQVEALQEQLGESKEVATSLRQQLTEQLSENDNDAELKASQQKLAEMQLEVSRERAEVSRQRAELQRLKAELEDRLVEPRETNVADNRIRAMREHLKELHDKEEEAKANQPESVSSGLANRIASLLQRVAGD